MLVTLSKLRQLRPLSHNFSVTYTMREKLYNESIDTHAIAKELRNTEHKKLIDRVYNLVSNDNNPNNYVKVKTKSPIGGYKIQSKEPFIVKSKPPLLNRILNAKRTNIITSIKKMKEALRGLSNMHIAGAVEHLSNSQKKVAKWVLPALYGILSTARMRGFDLHRLYIHRVLMGKSKRFYSIRYHAKGKSGKMKKDFCHVNILVQERNEERFYKEMAVGKVDEGLAAQIKQDLIIENAPLEEVTKYRDILSAKGRQQQRMLLKRKVEAIALENRNNGVSKAKKQVQLQVIDQQAQRFKRIMNERGTMFTRLPEREAIYLQNTEKKGRY